MIINKKIIIIIKNTRLKYITLVTLYKVYVLIINIHKINKNY